jgi:DNA adenine methylase
MNSPIPYFGGKSRMAAAIIERIPQHKTYAEVFGGAAWVLFKKPASAAEILNGLDRRLMNFYRAAKHHPEALAEEIAGLQPGRDLFCLFREEIDRPLLTDIQRAALYYYIQRFAFAGRPGKPTLATGPNRPLRCRAEMARRVIPLAAERLKEVMLESLSWERFIKLYDSPDTFFFIDPPYLGHHEYRHNLKEADYVELADMLKQIKGKFLMCHADGKIRNYVKGLNLEPVVVPYSTRQLAKGQPQAIGQELLISNY